MSTTNTSIVKQPLRFLEVPLRKFREEVIPHHEKIFEGYKACIQKLISVNDIPQLKKEVRDKKKTVKQLRDLLYEFDTLRTQVEDHDLNVFDSKTVSLRKVILSLISNYSDIEKNVNKLISAELEKIENVENVDPFQGADKIQIQGTIEDLKLQEHQLRLQNVEGLQQDIEGLHEVYTQLHQMVGEQAPKVEEIEANVEVANENVNSGLKQLIKAHKLKAATYPLAGAIVGGAIGGPIGLVAGAKVGALAMVGLGVTGYVAGVFTKRFRKAQLDEESKTHIENGVTDKSASAVDKKDI